MQSRNGWQVVAAEDADMVDGGQSASPLGAVLPSADVVPLCLTCAIIEGRLIADPTAQEESLAAATVCTIVDGRGNIIGAAVPLQHDFAKLQHGSTCYLGNDIYQAHLLDCLTQGPDFNLCLLCI